MDIDMNGSLCNLFDLFTLALALALFNCHTALTSIKEDETAVSAVATLLYPFWSCWCLAKSSFSHSISLALFVMLLNFFSAD